MNNKELELLIKAAENLSMAAKKTYGSGGSALGQLLVAINQYELTKVEIENNMNKEEEEMAKYYKQNKG